MAISGIRSPREGAGGASAGPACGITRRSLLQLMSAAGIGIASSALVGRAGAAGQPLVYTWEGYDAADLYKPYTAKHGGLPDFTLFGDLDEAFTKLQSGFTADVTTPGAESMGRWRDAGLFAPIDVSKLGNWPNLFDRLKTEEPALVDGTQWGVPFAWGASSVVFRTDLVGDYAENATWKILWDPKFKGKLAMKDGAPESVVTAAMVEGIADPFNMSDAEIAAVRGRLAEQQPLLRYYWGDNTTLEQSIASGEIVAAFGWSSTYTELRKQGVPVGFMVPKEGLVTWIDFLSLLASGGGSEELRYAVIDAMVSPESGAFLLSDYSIAAPNRDAYGLVDAEIVKSLGLDDPAAAANAGMLLRPFSPDSEQKIIAMFNEVKAGL